MAETRPMSPGEADEEFACETITNSGVEKDFEASFVTSLILGKTLVRYIVT